MNKEIDMNQVLNHPLTALVLTVLGIVFMMSLYKTGQRNKQVTTTAQVIESKVEKLRQEATQAQQELDASQSEDDFKKEQIIRDELLMQKEGEVVIQLPLIDPVEIEAEEPATANQSSWQEWQTLLFGEN
ncbi:MAG: septum formation initiator family protein [Patescibacteria group bacterium]